MQNRGWSASITSLWKSVISKKHFDFTVEFFAFDLRGSHKDDTGRMVMGFIDMGDQFIALSRVRHQNPDRDRHFGLVVDDRSHVRDLAVKAGAKLLDGSFLDFLDPWGNRIEVVECGDLQFSKSPNVLHAMGPRLPKSEKLLDELHKRGMG